MIERVDDLILRYWIIVVGTALILSQSRNCAAQNIAGQKPVLTVRAVASPRNKFRYEYKWFRTIWSYAEISCDVKNVSKRPVTIVTETVGWYTNWGTDNSFVHRVEWPTSANAAYPIVLKPGETYSKAVPIMFNGLKEGQKVTFRIRFDSNWSGSGTLSVPSHVVWSNPVTTRVPPAKP